MKKCPSCKHAVSTKAETCPSCGHPLKKKKRKSGCASTLLMLLILGGFVFYVMMNDDSPEAQHLDKQIDYKITSQRYIRDQLRAPSTAKFPLNAQVYERKGFWIVESYVEAQNGFGAIIRTYYAVAIEQGENSRHIVASEMSEYPIGLASLKLPAPVTPQEPDPVPVKKTEPYLDLTTKDGSTARLKPLEIAGDQLIVEMLDGKITQINFKDLDIASQSLVRRALNL